MKQAPHPIKAGAKASDSGLILVYIFMVSFFEFLKNHPIVNLLLLLYLGQISFFGPYMLLLTCYNHNHK